jgi:hypothetical protein
VRGARHGRGILVFIAHISAQLAFENISLVDFGRALDTISQVECLFFRRHLPHDPVETRSFLADGRILNCLSNAKFERHQIPFVLKDFLSGSDRTVQQNRLLSSRTDPTPPLAKKLAMKFTSSETRRGFTRLKNGNLNCRDVRHVSTQRDAVLD